MLEPQRTNLVVNSANGEYGNPPASEINTIAPDGSNDGLILIPNAEADRYEYNISSGTYATDTELTYSWYRKRITTPTGASRVGDLSRAGVNISFIGSTTQTQSDINGYDRFESVFKIVDGSATAILRMYFGNVIGIGNSSVAYWGHQLELGSYATSYIPNNGEANGVTRNQELCNNATPVINSEEGVLYLEASALANEAVNKRISLSDGTNNNRVVITLNGTNVSVLVRVNNVTEVTTTSFALGDITDLNKYAFKYKKNDFALWVNGVEVRTDNIGLTFPINTLTELNFTDGSSGSNFFGNTKGLKYYPKALSDVELQDLTTI